MYQIREVDCAIPIPVLDHENQHKQGIGGSRLASGARNFSAAVPRVAARTTSRQRIIHSNRSSILRAEMAHG